MKLTTLFLTLCAILAGAVITEAATIGRAGPWSKIRNKKGIKHYKIFAEHHGADLGKAKPVYDKCTILSGQAKAVDNKLFSQTKFLEFQSLGRKTVGINCPDCTPQELGNIYQTQLNMNCDVRDRRSADWKPKGGN
ncbi:hypothetical protein [Sporisorium scitamineum]|uniref:Uncharacterized protein n=1 Tax=Sporisorium scitamineum TaxID=49012 RepID=A0A0F7S3V6_9BASI|nr:hypothetical protein [Sporisorium scitamineum]